MRGIRTDIDGAVWTGFDESMQFKVLHDEMTRSVHFLARPNLESVSSVKFTDTHWVVGVYPWQKARWARFLRWLERYVKLPAPLRELVHASKWELSSRTNEFPEDVIERIQIQTAYLKSRNVEPMAICCGPRGYDELSGSAWNMYPMRPSLHSGCPDTLFGLPVRVVPWLEPDVVMVV